MPADPPIAVLLCAGYGTRMGALTRTTPKQLLPVGGRPLIDPLMEQIARLAEISVIHLVTNHAYVGRFREWAATWRDRLAALDRRLEIHDDGSTENANRLGGVGDLAFVLERVASTDGALVAGTDNVFRFSLEPFWRAFRAGADNLVLALREADPDALRRSGVLELGPGDRVIAVHEKPAKPPSPWACPSLYCLKAAALGRVQAYLDDGLSPDDLGALINALAAREPFRAFPVEGTRLHVGSAESLRAADEVLRREPILLDSR
jgi:glucose-1-phosphate thymidylyltransferase